VAEILPDPARDKPLEVWFQNEARVGQQGTLTRIWARKGTRPRAPRDQRYTWAYQFGAAYPARGASAGLVCRRSTPRWCRCTWPRSASRPRPARMRSWFWTALAIKQA